MSPKKTKGCRRKALTEQFFHETGETHQEDYAVKTPSSGDTVGELGPVVQGVCKEELDVAANPGSGMDSDRNEQKLLEAGKSESEETVTGALVHKKPLRKRFLKTNTERYVERKSRRTVKKTAESVFAEDARASVSGNKKKAVKKIKEEIANCLSGIEEAASDGIVKSEVTDESVRTKVRMKAVEAKKKKARSECKAATTEDTVESSKTVKRTKRIVIGISDAQAASAALIGAKVLKAGDGCKMAVGKHTSAAGSLEQSIYNAIAVGCRSFALFVRSRLTWNCAPLNDDVVERFKEAIEKYSFSIQRIVPHASYLINPGSADSEKLQKSRDAMVDECTRCERLGITLYNFHPGSTAGLCTREECICTIADSINYVIERTKFVTLVIETMAGQGYTIGGSFEEVRQIIDLVTNQERVGVCIDTCHIFAAGYDIRTEEGYNETMSKFEKIVGLNFLRAIHMNDSKGDLGSKRDRHENIGQGKIGMKGFSHFMNDSKLEGIPMILETPGGKEPQEMISLYKSVKE